MPIKVMRPKWATTDGQEFNTLKEARRHESFNKIMNLMPHRPDCTNDVAEFICDYWDKIKEIMEPEHEEDN